MGDKNLPLERRLDKMEDDMGEILSILRQLAPVISKEDYIKKCGNNGILLINEWNKKVNKAPHSIETGKRF